MGDQFSATLRSAVRIVPTEVVGLPVAPVPFFVAVGLVTGDQNCGLYLRPFADALQDVDHAHGVDLEGLHRVGNRPKDQWLGSEVEHHLGSDLVDHIGQSSSVPDVADVVVQPLV